MAAMKIEITQDDGRVQSRAITTRNGDNMNVHSQTAYLHRTGRAYPDPFRLNVRNPSEAHAPGIYELDPSSFRINGYGDLEINRYEMTLIPVKS